MNNTEARLDKEYKSTKIVIEKINKYISEGNFPSYYSLPLNVQFEVTSKCNLFCKHCYNQSGSDISKKDIPFIQILEFCKTLVRRGGIFQATISGGEPLLIGDDLWKLMDILHADGTIFNLISNGTLFNKNVISHLKNYQFFWIQISIDSFSPSQHDDFRGVKGTWEKAVKAAYSVALSGIPLRIASTVTPITLPYLEKYIQMAINLGASYLIIGEVMPSGRAFNNKEIFLSKEQRDFFYGEMNKLEKKYKKEISILVSGTQRLQLEYASSQKIDGAIIRPNGDIRLDCGCPFVIGNISKDDISEVWHAKADCWKHPLVQQYINSCDPVTGFSDIINNYQNEDIYI